MFQRSMPSENLVPDCLRHSPIHGGKEPSHRVQSLRLFTQKLHELALLERGLFDILKLKEIASNFSLFFIRFAILRRILGAEMRDGTRAGVGLKARQKEKEPVTDEEEEGQLWQSGVFGMETAKSLLNVVYYYNGKLFGLRGGEHRRICLKNFEIGDNYIRFEENVSKTFHVGLLHLKYEPHVVRHICHSVCEHHEPCLIEYYLLYIGLEQICAKEVDAFYFRPNAKRI